MTAIRVAVVGVGNNASALLQGWALARRDQSSVLGSPDTLAGYRISDIEWVAAFDISSGKIGKDLAEAIHAQPNNFPKLEPVPLLGVVVESAPVLDGLTESTSSWVPVIDGAPSDVEFYSDSIRNKAVDVLVNLTPAGSAAVATFWAEVALAAKCAFVNAPPDAIAQDPAMRARFLEAGLPLLGDDLESQMGATVIHRAILDTLHAKGLRVCGSYQINVGGNMDFRNLATRGESKRESKLRGLGVGGQEAEVYVVPSGGVFPFLGDHKVAHIRVDALGWLGQTNTVDIRLEINDSCSAATALADLIRIAKYELSQGTAGIVPEAGFYFKSAVNKKDLESARHDREKYLSE